MDNIYRCMNCGNNLTTQTNEGLNCQTCGEQSDFIQVTEENKNSIPFPKNLHFGDNEPGIDPNFCNDKEGICPCGVFIAHLINKQCDVIETATAKEPLYDTCHCKTSISACGHSISHRLTEPCTGQQ